MNTVAVYLSGTGSLDGSDVMTVVLACEVLQDLGIEPVAVGRDVQQGEVLNHRTARPEETPRNALDESARIVRGDIVDMRDLETDEIEATVLVGGGGTLTTWTDYHKRGEDCRVTERLKFHVMEFSGGDCPILALDNAGFVLGAIFRHTSDSPRLNPGSNPQLVRMMEKWDVELTDDDPCWDDERRVGCLPNLTQRDNLPALRTSLRDFFVSAGID
jgi:enhancing lycopene biosynthesis protein 2